MFLTSYRPFFSRVIVTARDTSTPHAKALSEKGAELVQVGAADPAKGFLKAFEGVDAVVNLLGQAPPEYGDAVGEAAIKSGAAVYFPSEYGSYVLAFLHCNEMAEFDDSDHRTHDFPGWEGPEWEFKSQHVRKYRELGAGKTRVISVYTGLFLEVLISPFRAFPSLHFFHYITDESVTSGLRHPKPDVYRRGLAGQEDRDDSEGRHRACTCGAHPPRSEPDGGGKRAGRRAHRGRQRERERGARHRTARARGVRRATFRRDRATYS